MCLLSYRYHLAFEMGENFKKDHEVKKEHLKWTQPMDGAYVQALLNQHCEGYQVDGSFTSTTYNNISRNKG